MTDDFSNVVVLQTVWLSCGRTFIRRFC